MPITPPKMDPRIKMAMALSAIGTILMLQRPASILFVSTALAAAVPILGRGRSWLRLLPLFVPVVGCVLIVSLLVCDLLTALYGSLRLLNLLTLTMLCFAFLDPEQMAEALSAMKVPYPFTFMVTTAMRYVPFLSSRIRRIIDAQRSRGIDMRFRLTNPGNLLALLLPLLVQSFLLAEQLAAAMELRGFSRTGRTSRHSYHIAPWECTILFLWLGIQGTWIWWERCS